MSATASGIGQVPAWAGIGLRAPHYREMLARRPHLAFLEVHSENYFGAGGPPHHYLQQLCEDYALSLHGVGLSLGSADPLDTAHLQRLKQLIRRYQPELVSEHLCWTSTGGVHTHDLLPLPFTDDMVRHLARRIRQVQDTLERRILVENVSSYVTYTDSNLPEWEFVAAVVEEADCGLLLDVNNLYVNAINHGFDAQTYLAAMPAARVGEIHLAGFEQGTACLIDTHSRPVSDAVWGLYHDALAWLGPRPTLIEWDSDIPPLDTLLEQARLANRYLEPHHELVRMATALA
jgi:uncharacterized protein (UPF0276 family)